MLISVVLLNISEKEGRDSRTDEVPVTTLEYTYVLRYLLVDDSFGPPLTTHRIRKIDFEVVTCFFSLFITTDKSRGHR